MKVTLFVLFALAYVATTLGLPAPVPRTIDDEIEFVPLEKQNPFGDQPIIDTGVIGYDSPFSNPFGGLLENLGGIMSRIKEQMDALLRRFPVARGNSSQEIPDFAIEGGIPSINFGDIDLGKGNTTSVTKIIDGHKVVINETEYNKNDENGAAFFKVRIVDVHPLDEVTTNKNAEKVPTVPTTRDRESVENTIENEIPKSREAPFFDNIESFDEVDNIQPFQKLSSTNREMEWNDVMPLETFEDNSLNSLDRIRPIDLSGDIRVNQIMADAGAPINPDAEFIYDTREPHAKQFVTFINPR